MQEENQTLSPDAIPPLSGESPKLHDLRPRPEGVVPKQSQAYVIAGLAVLILLAVMFSKSHPRPAQKPSAAVPAIFADDANQRNIEDLKRDLTEDQRKSEQQEQAQKSAGAEPSSVAGGATQPSAAPNDVQPQTEPMRDPVKDAERALNFKARFASNLVPLGNSALHSPAVQTDHIGQTAGPFEQMKITLNPATPVQSSGTLQGAISTTKRVPEVNVNSAYGQPYVLFEGTTIDTTLLNRLDSAFSGPVKVMVTDPVYSQDRQHVLIPEGTFILGDVQKVSAFSQKRLAVVFHRMLMPDGYSVDLDQFHGLDQAGETGLKDKVNNHYIEIFGASIALGIISGGAEATTTGGYNPSGSDMYRQGVASSLSQEGAHVLDRFINVLPTLTIREGHRIKVYLTQDLLLPAYENHTVPPNI